MKCVTSLIAVERATLSASVVGKEIVDCNLECQTIGQFAQKIANPVPRQLGEISLGFLHLSVSRPSSRSTCVEVSRT